MEEMSVWDMAMVAVMFVVAMVTENNMENYPSV